MIRHALTLLIGSWVLFSPASAGGDEADPGVEREKHLARLGVDRWHAAGQRGQGMKVAVLDCGFRGYRTQLGKALPARVTARSFRADGNMEARDSEHGVLCAEVLCALAPEADLLLATWDPSQPEQFLQAMQWARQQGARIVSCSIIMPSWSDGEGGGPIHEKLTRILGPGDQPGDMLCFASAGNTARRHWSGLFQDGGDGMHEWQPEQRDNPLKPWGTGRVAVELYSPARTDFQLHVMDTTVQVEVGRSQDRSDRHPAVRFTPEPGHRYSVRVRRLHGPPDRFHLVVLGANLGQASADSSIVFPADGKEVVAVGAVTVTDRRLSYSSCGPNSHQPKPDFVAPVPFPTMCRDRPFHGTSAAAPQAAGIAALCWSRHADWTAARVREVLQQWARDLGPAGHDWETGHGVVSLPAAPR